MSSQTFISGVVEGITDEAVLTRLFRYSNVQFTRIHVTNGKKRLEEKLNNYNRAAKYAPWFVLIDLDKNPCSVIYRKTLLPSLAPQLYFRVVVREIETWLMADRVRLARFLGVTESDIPLDVETVIEPKRKIVDLALKSKKQDLRLDIVPRSGNGRETGPGYAAQIIKFVQDEVNGWRPNVAAENSDSLRRCLRSLDRFKEGQLLK